MTMKEEIFRTAVLSTISAVGLAAILVAGHVLSTITGDDPYALVRYVTIRLAAVLVAIPVLTGLMVAVDYVTPGEWMRAVGDDPKAAGTVMGAVVLVIGAILCWT